MTDAILAFQGKYRFLSNFYPAAVEYEGATYPTVEHAYQAAKTLDDKDRALIRRIPPDLARHAKTVGRHVAMRPGWDGMRIPIMLTLVRRKFKHETLRNLLIATSPAVIVEGNTWGDTFWGYSKGEGENNLGKILMQVRDEISGSAEG